VTSTNRHHDDSVTHRLGMLMHQLRGLAGPSPEDLVGIDLPRHQLRALFIVAKHGPISVGHLAEATDASLASTSSLADRLVRSGHLRREADPADRRRVLLVATAQGLDVADQLMKRFNQRFERLVEAMSPEGREALEAGLTDMIRAADELGLRADTEHHGGSA
jgi:DNA-binding MarR family transcriptional regulator